MLKFAGLLPRQEEEEDGAYAAAHAEKDVAAYEEEVFTATVVGCSEDKVLISFPVFCVEVVFDVKIVDSWIQMCVYDAVKLAEIWQRGDS